MGGGEEGREKGERGGEERGKGGGGKEGEGVPTCASYMRVCPRPCAGALNKIGPMPPHWPVRLD